MKSVLETFHVQDFGEFASLVWMFSSTFIEIKNIIILIYYKKKTVNLS